MPIKLNPNLSALMQESLKIQPQPQGCPKHVEILYTKDYMRNARRNQISFVQRSKSVKIKIEGKKIRFYKCEKCPTEKWTKAKNKQQFNDLLVRFNQENSKEQYDQRIQIKRKKDDDEVSKALELANKYHRGQHNPETFKRLTSPSFAKGPKTPVKTKRFESNDEMNSSIRRLMRPKSRDSIKVEYSFKPKINKGQPRRRPQSWKQWAELINSDEPIFNEDSPNPRLNCPVPHDHPSPKFLPGKAKRNYQSRKNPTRTRSNASLRVQYTTDSYDFSDSEPPVPEASPSTNNSL